ncbi:MAG: c-type cytochrome [Candidatus Binataceae bacterium]
MGKEIRIMYVRWIFGLGLLTITLAVCSPANAADLAAAKQSYTIFCAKCHGADGKGDGPGGATLSTHPRDFANCAEMSKISDATLFKAIKDGGASVGLSSDMQAQGGGFDDGEIHDLVKFVRTFCKK